MVKRKMLAVLSLVMFAGYFGTSGTAQIMSPLATDTGLGGSNTITGSVLVSTGGRLERSVTIRLRTMTRGDRVTSTDDKGYFAFRGLVSGDYTLVIEKEKDFEPFSQTVSVIQVRGFPPQNYNLSVRLTPKANTQPKPAVLNASLAGLPERGKSLFLKSRDLATAGDHKGAVEQLTLLTAEFPTFMLGFNELGVEYLRLNELEKAEESFRTALKIEPEAFAPMMNHGIVLVQMKRYADAEPPLRDAVKNKADSAVGHYFLGQALANLGKFEEAAKELSAAVKLGGPEMKEAHRLLAIIYSAQGDKARAASELEIYLQLAPNTPDADRLRIVIRELKGPAAPTPADKRPGT